MTDIASIDVKKDEVGLLDFAKIINCNINFFSAEELNSVQGDFTESAFVQKTVGVNNVCERAAVKCSENGNLLLKKQSSNGVTLAIAEKNITLDFNR